MHRTREKTLDLLLPLDQVVRKAACDRDLQWFLSLTDLSVTTLIRNYLKINPNVCEQDKGAIEKVSHRIIVDLHTDIIDDKTG